MPDALGNAHMTDSFTDVFSCCFCLKQLSLIYFTKWYYQLQFYVLCPSLFLSRSLSYYTLWITRVKYPKNISFLSPKIPLLQLMQIYGRFYPCFY